MATSDSTAAVLGAPPGANEAPAPTAVPVGPDAPITSIMRTTRAMRRLAPDPVPHDLIRTVLEAATWAPSGGNWQIAHYVVVTDRAKLARLAPLWGRVIDDFGLAFESAGASELSDPSHRKTGAAVAYQREHFAETPALIVVCDDQRSVGRTRGTLATIATMARRGGLRRALRIVEARPRWERGAPASIYPAVENLLLAARANGLAACFTSWHLFAEDEFKRIIGIPRNIRTWGLIPIGYPLGRFGPVNRRPVEEFIHWESW